MAKLDKELAYREFVDLDNRLIHAPYIPEIEFYTHIQSGDVDWVKKETSQGFHLKEGFGKLSDNSLRNLRYHFIITAATIARYCIHAGMSLEESYEISDIYIRKADVCTSSDEISALHPLMCVEYAKRMKALRNDKIFSLPVTKCINYIYANLHKRITVTMLAEEVGLNPNYLSRLFVKETGSSINEYIRTRKLETARKMLIFSDYSPAEIAGNLAFPSQSYFTEVFRKHTGMSPAKYRSLNSN